MEVTPYDAIVSDYQMPGMNGIAFLHEVRSRFGDVPFIIMTAHSREEVVIEALNSGATGYLQKGMDMGRTFTELIHLIRNAAGKRDAERALAESRGHYDDIVENAYDMIVHVRPEGWFVEVNRAWCETLGYTAEEAVSMTVFDLIAPEALDVFMEMFSALLRGVTPESIETVFRAKDGRRIPVRGHMLCRMADGVPVMGCGIFCRYFPFGGGGATGDGLSAAVSKLPLPLLFADALGVIAVANEGAKSLFCKTAGRLVGLPVRDLFADPDAWDRIAAHLADADEWQGEAGMQTIDDEEGCVLPLCCAVAYTADGAPGGYSMAFPGAVWPATPARDPR
jgi:PAS domain S-box-containing protein